MYLNICIFWNLHKICYNFYLKQWLSIESTDKVIYKWSNLLRTPKDWSLILQTASANRTTISQFPESCITGHCGSRRKIDNASWCRERYGRALSRLSLRHVVICSWKRIRERPKMRYGTRGFIQPLSDWNNHLGFLKSTFQTPSLLASSMPLK